MTVAIAAICKFMNAPLIVAVEDHMITAGDIEFEQPQPKVWQIIKGRCIALLFGDVAAQTEIAAATEREMLLTGTTDVGNTAHSYAKFLDLFRQRAAVSEILHPLGLTEDTFSQKQQSMNSELVIQLAEQLQRHYRRQDAEGLGGAIIAGADALGAHIYVVENGKVQFMDHIGFAAVGMGKWHAESQFMFGEYTKTWEFDRALSLVYTAKKRAEVAPGVGLQTDLVIITTSLPQIYHFPFDHAVVKTLEGMYVKGQQKYDEARYWFENEVKNYMQSQITPPPSPTSSSGGSPPPAPPKGTA